jgi:hypothetical protein
MNTPIQNRYEFVYLFDVVNGTQQTRSRNLPRLDPETSCAVRMSVSSARSGIILLLNTCTDIHLISM